MRGEESFGSEAMQTKIRAEAEYNLKNDPRRGLAFQGNSAPDVEINLRQNLDRVASVLGESFQVLNNARMNLSFPGGPEQNKVTKNPDTVEEKIRFILDQSENILHLAQGFDRKI